MKLAFTVEAAGRTSQLQVDIDTFVIAGWAGRDRAAIDHHIEELAAIGVPRPSAVPLYYRVAENQLTQSPRIQAVGPHSSGEVETFVFTAGGELYVSLTSDHTDRKLESHSVALSKQLCAKPVGTTAWRFADVAGHWDELVIRSRIVEDGQQVVYQEGALSALRLPVELINGYTNGRPLPERCAMSCGTVGAIGGIRPSTSFEMELFDPRSGRSLRHAYTVDVLPEVA
ncbi:DUF2848 domain-containing protein [Ramlibacter sp. RBP-2]|uniref:DUF2848 domain-containing protein n=1 Tax=Ramlibacter lithotrophicus TaxID=2606681 RepID=A0A7X6DEA5_9BURK|nr:DUF2848 domain-containing protein [Ramlibacter lithotrophicus]NKE65527.1 DUF2848 domain-containing protein [Ramlibacter lithotrophicus]